MSDRRAADGSLLADAERLNWIGSILRHLTFDELPQLWNILRGDMSLIGPRPLLPQYLCRYSPEQRRRLEVRPGLTGWAQVNGGTTLEWQRQFELDVWYVDNRSAWLDARILGRSLLLALGRLFSRPDARADLREEFGGNPTGDTSSSTAPCTAARRTKGL